VAISIQMTLTNEQDDLPADFTQRDQPDPVPLVGDVLDLASTDEHSELSADVSSQPFSPTVVVSEHFVQDLISPSTGDIPTTCDLADGLYTIVVDNETVHVTVSHTDPGVEVVALPGCNIYSGVQLHSDLLLIDA